MKKLANPTLVSSPQDQLSILIRDRLTHSHLAPEVATKLYPHQLKALTFLLAREQEKSPLLRGPTGQLSLWREKMMPGFQRSWSHIVTQAEEFSKPFEAKGAILADDVRIICTHLPVEEAYVPRMNRWVWGKP